jgi:hypothetical protein
LRWASEVGAGSWTNLRDTAAYVSRDHDLTMRAWYLAAPLADLGHLDVAWEEQRWSIAPPALVLERGLGTCVYLAGSRPDRVMRRFGEAADDIEVFPFDIAQDPAPHGVFAKCASIDTARSLADRLRVPLVFDPSSSLAAAVPVPGLSDDRLGAPPALEDGLERFDAASSSWVKVDDRERPGLYRMDLHGRNIYRLRREENWYRVDRSEGLFLELGRSAPLLRWHPPSSDFRIPSALELPRWLTLPAIAERAAVASSGLLPVRRRGKRLYRNVSRVVATILAERLTTELVVEGGPSSELSAE